MNVVVSRDALRLHKNKTCYLLTDWCKLPQFNAYKILAQQLFISTKNSTPNVIEINKELVSSSL